MSSLDGQAVAALLATALPAPVIVERMHPLTGGASADTWSLDVVDAAGVPHALIVRRGAGRGGVSLGLDARVEPLVQRAAGAAAVPVAEVVAIFDDPVLGTGYVMRRLSGETIPRKLLRDPGYAVALSRLAADCAAALAAIHAVPLDRLPAMPELPAAEQLNLLESLHRSIGQPVPTFELGLRWLHDNLPPPGPLCLVHGDFRMGNFLLDQRSLVAVLDWELAHLGDAMEDIAWLCTRAWRFGGAGEVGGFASREDFYRAYCGVDPGRVHFWEVLSTLKWGVICQLQSFVHLRGELPSVERAAIGRRVTETELDLLLVLEERHERSLRSESSNTAPAPRNEALGSPAPSLRGAGLLDERPTAAELVAAVADFLEREVQPALDGRLSFHTKVAANALRIVERELNAGPAAASADRARLRELTGADGELPALNAVLAQRIRAGELPADDPALRDHLVRSVLARIAIDNPRYPSLREAEGYWPEGPTHGGVPR